MILHIKDGKVIKIKAHQTVSAPSHQKTHGFLRIKERKQSKSGNFCIYFSKFHTDVKVRLVLKL